MGGSSGFQQVDKEDNIKISQVVKDQTGDKVDRAYAKVSAREVVYKRPIVDDPHVQEQQSNSGEADMCSQHEEKVPASGVMTSEASRGTCLSPNGGMSTTPAPGKRSPVCRVWPARPGSGRWTGFYQWGKTRPISKRDRVTCRERDGPSKGANKIKIPQAKEQQQITAQQKKYGMSCWEESISMEDKGLAQYSATQEKFSKQRADTMHTTKQEKRKTCFGKDDSSRR